MAEKYVVFQVAEGSYCIPLAQVNQIIRFENVIEVPTAPSYVDGVINLGGEVVPVVNMRARFSLTGSAITRRNRIIIVERDGVCYGILVDGVREILELEEDSIAQEAAAVFGMKSEFVRGIAKVRDALLVLLDIFKVLSASAETKIRE